MARVCSILPIIELKSFLISTACWRGFHCVYTIANDALYLREAYLKLDEKTQRLIQQSRGIKLFGKVAHRYTYQGIYLKNWKKTKSDRL